MTLISSPPCPGCGGIKSFEVTEAQAELLSRPKGDRPHIQHVLPEFSPSDRERLISGYCSPCWDNLFESDN